MAEQHQNSEQLHSPEGEFSFNSVQEKITQDRVRVGKELSTKIQNLIFDADGELKSEYRYRGLNNQHVSERLKVLFAILEGTVDENTRITITDSDNTKRELSGEDAAVCFIKEESIQNELGPLYQELVVDVVFQLRQVLDTYVAQRTAKDVNGLEGVVVFNPEQSGLAEVSMLKRNWDGLGEDLSGQTSQMKAEVTKRLKKLMDDPLFQRIRGTDGVDKEIDKNTLQELIIRDFTSNPRISEDLLRKKQQEQGSRSTGEGNDEERPVPAPAPAPSGGSAPGAPAPAPVPSSGGGGNEGGGSGGGTGVSGDEEMDFFGAGGAMGTGSSTSGGTQYHADPRAGLGAVATPSPAPVPNTRETPPSVTRSNQAEAAPAPVPPEQTPSPEPSQTTGTREPRPVEPDPNERFQIGVAGRKMDLEKFATEESMRLFRESYGKVKWFDFLRKLKLKVLEGYYVKKWQKEILKACQENNNAYLRTEIATRWTKLGLFRRNEVSVVDADANRQQSVQAGEAGGREVGYLAKLKDAGALPEGEEVLLMSENVKQQFVPEVVEPMLAHVRTHIQELRQGQHGQTRENLNQMVNQRIIDFREKVRRNRFPGIAGQERDQILAYLDGEQQFGTDMIGVLIEAVNREQNQTANHQTALDIIKDRTDIALGRIKWGAEHDHKRNALEKLEEWMQEKKLPISPMVAGILGSSAAAGLAHFMTARGATSAASALTHLAPPLTGMVTGALSASIRRGLDVERDFTLQGLEKAYGRSESQEGYRGELESLMEEMVSAESLHQMADQAHQRFMAIQSEENRTAMVDAYGTLKAYLDISAEEGINAISFSSRSSVAQERMQLIADMSNIAGSLNLGEDSTRRGILEAAVNTKRTEIEDQVLEDRDNKEVLRRKYKRRQQLKAAGIGMASGGLGAFGSQAALSAASEGWLTLASGDSAWFGGAVEGITNPEPGSQPTILHEAAMATAANENLNWTGEGMEYYAEGKSAIEAWFQTAEESIGKAFDPEERLRELFEAKAGEWNSPDGELTITIEENEVTIEIGGETIEAVLQDGTVTIEDISPADPQMIKLAERLDELGIDFVVSDTTVDMQEVLTSIPMGEWHSDIAQMEGLQVKVGGPTDADSTYYEFAFASGEGHLEARLQEGELIFAQKPSDEMLNHLESLGITNIREQTIAEVAAHGGNAVEALRSEGMIAPVDHTEYYMNNSVGADGNELEFHTKMSTDANGNRILTLDASDMMGNTSYQEGLTPEVAQPDSIFGSDNGVVAFRFGNEIPGQQDTMMLVRLNEQGQLHLNPNADPNQMVEVQINGQWQEYPMADLARNVLDENYMQTLADGDIATELTGRQQLFTLANQNGSGAIHVGRLDPSVQTYNGGEMVFQSLSTIRGSGQAEVAIEASGWVGTPDAERITAQTIEITPDVEEVVNEPEPELVPQPEPGPEEVPQEPEPEPEPQDTEAAFVPLIATPIYRRRVMEYPESRPDENAGRIRFGATEQQQQQRAAQTRETDQRNLEDEERMKVYGNRLLRQNSRDLQDIKHEITHLEEKIEDRGKLRAALNPFTKRSLEKLKYEKGLIEARIAGIQKALDEPGLNPEYSMLESEKEYVDEQLQQAREQKFPPKLGKRRKYAKRIKKIDRTLGKTPEDLSQMNSELAALEQQVDEGERLNWFNLKRRKLPGLRKRRDQLRKKLRRTQKNVKRQERRSRRDGSDVTPETRLPASPEPTAFSPGQREAASQEGASDQDRERFRSFDNEQLIAYLSSEINGAARQHSEAAMRILKERMEQSLEANNMGFFNEIDSQAEDLYRLLDTTQSREVKQNIAQILIVTEKPVENTDPGSLVTFFKAELEQGNTEIIDQFMKRFSERPTDFFNVLSSIYEEMSNDQQFNDRIGPLIEPYLLKIEQGSRRPQRAAA